MIHLTPYGGLANRMRALNATIEFAQTINRPLVVIWFKKPELNAAYDDLFTSPQLIDFQNITIKTGNFADRFIYQSPRKHNLWLPGITRYLKFDTYIYPSRFIELRSNDTLKDCIRNSKRVFIESCYEFGDYYSSLSKNFIPQPDILTAVDNFVAKNFSSTTIGIHIRRTDNIMSIKKSPLPLFIDAMHKEIEKCADTKFYIASDDEKTKEELKQIFGNRILTIHTDCNRNSLNGMKEAVKEMWILSRTTKIYGCFYSTYPIIASKLTNIPLEILQID